MTNERLAEIEKAARRVGSANAGMLLELLKEIKRLKAKYEPEPI